MHRVLTIAGFTLVGVATVARAGFVEEPQFGQGTTLTVAWGDADGDGDPDLLSGNQGTPKLLYLNDGAGGFTEVSPFGTGRNTFAIVWGDFDNDGDQDMAEGRRNQTNALFVNNGDGTFTSVNAFGTTARRTIAMAWGDCDNDGDLDLAVGNGILGTAQQNYLYRNQGGGVFTEEAQFGLGQTDAVAWGDFDNDGDLDLAVGNGGFQGLDQQNYLYVNNGNGTFTERAEFGLKDTAALAWGDYDNDGDLDLAVGNWNAMGSLLYVNNGNGTFTGHAEFGSDDTNTLNWGDADDDGDLDLATGNGDFSSAGQNYLFVNDGAGSFAAQGVLGLGSTDGIAFADCDGDLDLDIAAGNEHTPTQNYLYRNTQNDGAALIVHLVGHRHDLGAPYSNRDGIGAKVDAYVAGHPGEAAFRLGHRELSASGGFSAQNSIDAHFGLPGQAAVDLVIRWPGSGGAHITQTVAAVAVGQRITIHEQAAPAGVIPAIASEVRLVATPNPAHGTVAFAVVGDGVGAANWSAARVEILDAAGRSVRNLPWDQTGTTGLRPVQWDGIDEEGHRAPAGVYVARVLGTRNLEPARVVILR